MNKYEFWITAALNNHDNLTGFQISLFVKENFGKTLGYGTLYLYLDRLVKSGMIIRTKENNRYTYYLKGRGKS